MTLWEVMYANEAVETMAGVEEEPGLQNMAGVSQDIGEGKLSIVTQR